MAKAMASRQAARGVLQTALLAALLVLNMAIVFLRPATQPWVVEEARWGAELSPEDYEGNPYFSGTSPQPRLSPGDDGSGNIGFVDQVVVDQAVREPNSETDLTTGMYSSSDNQSIAAQWANAAVQNITLPTIPP